MFRADLAWAGPLLGVVAVAIHTYLRGTDVKNQWSNREALGRMRDAVWEMRSDYLDALLLHECGAADAARDMIWLLGWEEDKFVLACLHDDRAVLDA